MKEIMNQRLNARPRHLWLIGALMLPLTACNGGISGVTPTGYSDAYRVGLTNLGYEVDCIGPHTQFLQSALR